MIDCSQHYKLYVKLYTMYLMTALQVLVITAYQQCGCQHDSSAQVLVPRCPYGQASGVVVWQHLLAVQ